jgi:hypothetical protein
MTDVGQLVYNPDRKRYSKVRLRPRGTGRAPVSGTWPPYSAIAELPAGDAYDLTTLGPMTRSLRAGEAGQRYGLTSQELAELAPLCHTELLKRGEEDPGEEVFVLDGATRRILSAARDKAGEMTAARAGTNVAAPAAPADSDSTGESV